MTLPLQDCPTTVTMIPLNLQYMQFQFPSTHSPIWKYACTTQYKSHIVCTSFDLGDVVRWLQSYTQILVTVYQIETICTRSANNMHKKCKRLTTILMTVNVGWFQSDDTKPTIQSMLSKSDQGYKWLNPMMAMIKLDQWVSGWSQDESSDNQRTVTYEQVLTRITSIA